MTRVKLLCPGLRRVKVLVDDLSLHELECLAGVEELEVHMTWSGLTAGLSLLTSSWSSSLTSLIITFLDNYSWSAIVNIGEYQIKLSQTKSKSDLNS